jgi:hypothetical protein
MQATRINIIVNDRKTLYNSNGSIAGYIEIGYYIAELNIGQQPYWYSLYESDNNFAIKGTVKIANVALSVDYNGRVALLA